MEVDLLRDIRCDFAALRAGGGLPRLFLFLRRSLSSWLTNESRRSLSEQRMRGRASGTADFRLGFQVLSTEPAVHFLLCCPCRWGRFLVTRSGLQMQPGYLRLDV